MATLVVEQVAKAFPTRTEPLEVLRDISLKLRAGENLAVIGPSGSGKSTLLHILGTLDRPTSGRMELDGTDPFQLAEAELAHFRNRHGGFVFRDHHLRPQLSVMENVLIPALAEGSPCDETNARARELLERVGLGKRLDHRPAELSGGERQRVGVARALVLRPKLLLADEPTGNLDRTNARGIGQLLVDVHEQEATILVVVTHSHDLAAMMQRQLELDGGVLTPV
jgi:lipoprotein-releasing system ATP-binding protein